MKFKKEDGVKFRNLSDADADEILKIYESNPLYFRHLNETASLQKVLHDLRSLPPGATRKNKHNLGFFDGENLIAYAELVSAFPDEKCVLIGLFIVSAKVQGRGVGSKIVNFLMKNFKRNGFEIAILSSVEGNEQSLNFWLKNGFYLTDETEEFDDITLLTMQCEL